MHSSDSVPIGTAGSKQTSAAAPVWQQLIGPLDENAFFSRYWETTSVHVERSDPERFAGWLSVSDIEHLLGCQDLYFPGVQLTRAGTSLAYAEYTDDSGRILPARLISQYQAGATLILSQAHRLFPALAGVSRALQQLLGWRCQTNVYLSPAHAQGFATHYDTHDVFVLQVSGQKVFRFYRGGVDLPFCDERFEPAHADAARFERSVTLQPGDTLYIPRGLLHDAVALGDAPSLHITVGVFPVVVRDVLQEMVQIAAENSVALRRSVPLGNWRGRSGEYAEREDSLSERLSAALTPATVEQALSRLRDDLWVDMRPDCQGLLSACGCPAEIAAHHRLVIRSTSPNDLERGTAVLKLRTSGELLEFREPMSSAVERLVIDGSAVVGDLVGLTAPQQVALARRLLLHGVVDLQHS